MVREFLIFRNLNGHPKNADLSAQVGHLEPPPETKQLQAC